MVFTISVYGFYKNTKAMTFFNLKNTEVASRTPCGWDTLVLSREQPDTVVQTRTLEMRPPPPYPGRRWAAGPRPRGQAAAPAPSFAVSLSC